MNTELATFACALFVAILSVVNFIGIVVVNMRATELQRIAQLNRRV